jgi:hypothetical protein
MYHPVMHCTYLSVPGGIRILDFFIAMDIWIGDKGKNTVYESGARIISAHHR